MSGALASVENSFPASERRLHTRQQLRSLAYVVLDEGNGGIVLNISEGGFSVQAVTSLVEDALPSVRFQLSGSREWIETGARIAWRGESKKVVGLAFVDLPDQAAGQIREWISRESALDMHPSQAPGFSSENEQPAAHPAPASEVIPIVSAARAAAPPAGRAPSRTPGWAQYSTLSLSGSTAKGTPKAKGARRNYAAIAALLTFFALGSMVAGWEFGRGGWDKTLQKVGRLAWLTRASAPEPAPSATVVAPVSEIEVVDANNQRLTIPFDGPVSSMVESPRQPMPAKLAPQAQARKPQIAFRTWVLTPPHTASGPSAAKGADNSSPPAVSDSPDSSGAIDPSRLADSRTLAPPPPPPAQQLEHAATTLEQGVLIHRVDPVYPLLAKEQRVEGTVKLHITIGEDGAVRGVELMGGPSLLLEAARSAVRQWLYSPTLLNGRPIETQRDISLVFHL
ncbi:MAG: TonB family protein [Acidobacteriia bacterium]|nr:TonB family protein [Terriglobia bacterium]